MPIVHIYRDPEEMPDRWLPGLVSLVRYGVALVLSVPPDERGGDASLQLHPEDVLVHVWDRGPFDYGTKPVEVTVFAHHHPYRMAVGEDVLATRLMDAIERAIPETVTEAFVQVMLMEISYAPLKRPPI